MSVAGTTAIGRALDVDCTICGARENEACSEPIGEASFGNQRRLPRPPHVERGRDARWAKMGMKGEI